MASSFDHDSLLAAFTTKRPVSVDGKAGNSDTKTKHSLLSFLATAQALNLELLPVPWESARPFIGTGATSIVNEALADLHTSFAFKCVEKDSQKPGLEEEVFRIFTNEISVLAYPPIRDHPNIAQLQGICWDIGADGRVWPVLLFEKSYHGDLYSFLKSPEGKALSTESRLKLCSDIGEAVSGVHSYGMRSENGVPT